MVMAVGHGYCQRVRNLDAFGTSVQGICLCGRLSVLLSLALSCLCSLCGDCPSCSPLYLSDVPILVSRKEAGLTALFSSTFIGATQCQFNLTGKHHKLAPFLNQTVFGCADTSKQPADQLEMDYATGSTDNAFANGVEVEAAPVRPDSHAVQEPGSSEIQENLPSGTDSPDTAAPIVHSGAAAALLESSSADYYAAPTINNDITAETMPDMVKAASEEEGPLTAEEGVQSLTPCLSLVEGRSST